MAKTDIWMPLYIGDYLGDTSRLTTVGHGAYMLLIMDYWMSGPPSDDDEELAAITRLPLSEWIALRPKIAKFFEVNDGKWHHKRISKEMAKALANSEERKKAGTKGAEKRWQKDSKANSSAIENGESIAEPIAEPSKTIANAWQNDGPSPSPSPSLKAKPNESGGIASSIGKIAVYKTPLPPSFDISPEVEKWARTKGYSADLPAYLEAFRLKAEANGYEKSNWESAFKTSILEDWGKIRDRKNSSTKTALQLIEEAEAQRAKN